ncbi:hypothetical protein [Streptomyces sp. NPDC001652]|uniref:barstar family protein n=1 Tax=Streptomyces sp. NPDC001652 TaxID=3154393 RepID=UPI003329B51E
MAEALVGPGHYFGREWNAFRYCLGGGFGIAAPFTLVWHDSHIARQAFADDVSGEGLTYFEEIVQLLERRGATVELRWKQGLQDKVRGAHPSSSTSPLKPHSSRPE